VLDHVVLATADLAETCRWLGHATGVVPGDGGPHLGMGTRNQLCSLGDGRYLEIIGPDPDQPQPAAPRPFGIDRLVEPGIAAWCARRTELHDVIARARSVGYRLVGPIPMQRQAPGGLICWQLAVPAPDSVDAALPFFIDWGDTPHPSSSAVAGLTLTRIHAVAPGPHGLLTRLAALGEAIDLESGPKPGLTVELRGPGGRVTIGPAAYS
jgi:hypothetical protein